MSALHRPRNPVRIVTASALFDGHDAAINVVRRILMAQGCEVIHLGHNRSVGEVVRAAVEEDAQGVAVSSYQGGHVEYFEYLVRALRDAGAGSVRVFGGGGGVIVPGEIARLREGGVTIFSPEDGRRMGLPGMVNAVVRACDTDPWGDAPATLDAVVAGDRTAVARAITGAELGRLGALRDGIRAAAAARRVPVLGVTGTGGSGKSSLTDEVVRRLRADQRDALRIAVIAVDPTRRRGRGALLGDRIRANAIHDDDGEAPTFFRSLATRGAHEVPAHLQDAIDVAKAAGFDLVIVETPGIGQGDAGIAPLADVSLYVMTPEFGAASQLEKIDMLDLADVVAINKFERPGADDALRDVARQMARNREAFGAGPGDMPVFGTSAATFNDDGVTALYQHVRGLLADRGMPVAPGALPAVGVRHSSRIRRVVPDRRARYLAEIAETVRGYHAETARMAEAARRLQRAEWVAGQVGDDAAVAGLVTRLRAELPPGAAELVAGWDTLAASYRGDEQAVAVRDGEVRSRLTRESPSGNPVPRVAVPRFADHGDVVSFLRRESLPGFFPFTAGVFRFRRDDEDPARMFAGEGDPFRTNRRFAYLSRGAAATRLSTAFDSVTLYGRDPDPRPDVYGKVGTSGVSVATLDDMTALYDGFDLVDPATSVSMTINGPAPTVLAFFLNTAIDQQVARFRGEHGRDPDDAERAALAAHALACLRGTVQADILKEDQGQNTCLFSTEFSLRMMADVQEWFIAHGVRNFYSVSISGYHIAEAGANPVTQLAFTLANAFTYVEAYLARGMDIDAFAPSLSFFFSNGMDPEYTVIGRVARRIWAVAMRERYGAGERAQKLKYHVQTSGRSLHAQEMDFNDIRTTLQALVATYDNANSLHTNAYDEAVTTPTAQSVRRALAIQLIINREWGLAMNENPLQGSFVVDELTDLVEEAVLREFDAISARGGVLGAMETGYQRGRIQDESMRYEQRKHDGSLPIVGVNTFLPDESGDDAPRTMELARATEDERRSQLERVRAFRAAHAGESDEALRRLKDAALAGDNVFAVLMDAARVCTLQQVTDAFFEVGGQYRRNV